MPGFLPAAIYTRYSSDRQRDASLEDQERGGRKRAADLGLDVVAIYADRAISGAEFLRPDFQRLIEDARRKRFLVVIAESLDRFSRDQEHIAGFYKQMRHLGVRIITVAEGEINELHIGLKGTMNALYLKDLGEKTHRGLEGRIKEGKSAGGNAFGYQVVKRFAPDGTPERGDRSIDPGQAEVVRRIFEEYASGLSSRAIAARLNEDGIPGPSDDGWGASTIHGNRERGTGILNNELYIGRLIWNRQSYRKDPTTGKRQAHLNPPSEWLTESVPHLQIVEQELWNRVRERQASNIVKNTPTRAGTAVAPAISSPA
ncbi:recombinase [Rubellimicrobium mesophilum DSM 19309]|uniref:Recombinase n=1 Tax=Rubellimicrobium mesophilum DSM 19309 TaxID=442562 RepID=A0A017HJ20_9RHOB|nr:recombinase family protein [Rubellimicrobium mesophilum]EYD74356.1 recombinase [Rubellimicrobium mesophilum DSM 19309]